MTGILEYRFGNRRVAMSTREIWCDNELIAIEPKAFDLLVYLICNRDRAVDKNELQDEIWRGTIVTEAALTRCVMKARRAIGDDAADAIRTLRRHGYRFSMPVEEIRQEPGGGSQELPLPDKPSIAVLPFTNLSNDPGQQYFSDGITEDIITELSRFRSLFVIARHSSFAFRDQTLKASQIAAELGVAYIIEGSIQRYGDRIRINVRLVDAADDSHTWSERYDREIGDILLVQEELAATVAATVGGRVEATRGRKHIDSAGVESYDYLLRAQMLYYQVSKPENDEALRLLERAIAIEPDNARALILMAAVYSMASWSFWAEDNEAARKTSLELGQQSIDLDDSDSLAHALFAEILFDCGQREQSEHHFLRAIALNPNDIAARALYASKLSAQGRSVEGLEQLAVAERLDPFGLLWIPWIKGSVMFGARQYEAAIQALRSMSKPPNEANFILAASLGRLGRQDEAAKYINEFLRRAREDMPEFPGNSLEDWVPLFGRMLDYEDAADLDHLMDSLRLAGWK